MQYRELAPPRHLAPLVACFWTLEGHAAETGGEVQPILPDGRPELIVHLGDPFERLSATFGFERQPAVIFAGQLTERLVLRPTGRMAVVGVRLHADAGPALLRIPQHEVAGRTLGVDDVSARLARALAGVRDRALSPDDAVASIADRLAPFAARVRLDPRIRYAVDAIRRQHGLLSIDRLAAEIGSTRRHLERRFQQLVGLTPKRLARIARFQRALQTLESVDRVGAGVVTAALYGYADQAHFVRDFRDLAGCAPGEHLLHAAAMTGFFRYRS